MAAASSSMVDTSRSVWLPHDLVMDEIVRKLPINCLIKLRYEVSSDLDSDFIHRYILDEVFGVYDDDGDDFSGVMIMVSSPIRKYYKKHGSLPNYLFGHIDCQQLRHNNFTPTHWSSPMSHYFEIHEASYRKVWEPISVFLGCVNGVFIFKIHRNFWTWNPVTDEYRRSEVLIPPSPTPRGPGDTPRFCTSERLAFGCGSFAESNDLKVVCIRARCYVFYPAREPDRRDEFYNESEQEESEQEESEESSDESEQEESDECEPVLDASGDDFMEETGVRDLNVKPDYIVEVYNISTDSMRRLVVPQIFLQIPPGEKHYDHTCTPTKFSSQTSYRNSSISWLVSLYVRNRWGCAAVKLLTFHMATEVFQITSIPDDILGDRDSVPFHKRRYYDTEGRSIIQLSSGIIARLPRSRFKFNPEEK